MGMKKADMRAEWVQYHLRMSEAREAHHAGLWRKAVELALSSWGHVDGMMQYERRYLDAEFQSIEAIDFVLQYAPLLRACPKHS